jgi:hypothetical protein
MISITEQGEFEINCIRPLFLYLQALHRFNDKMREEKYDEAIEILRGYLNENTRANAQS